MKKNSCMRNLLNLSRDEHDAKRKAWNDHILKSKNYSLDP